MLLDRCLINLPPASLVFPHFLSPLDFKKQLLIRLVQLVLVLVVEVFILIIHPGVYRVQELVGVLFEFTFQRHWLLVIVPI